MSPEMKVEAYGLDVTTWWESLTTAEKNNVVRKLEVAHVLYMETREQEVVTESPDGKIDVSTNLVPLRVAITDVDMDVLTSRLFQGFNKSDSFPEYLHMLINVPWVNPTCPQV